MKRHQTDSRRSFLKTTTLAGAAIAVRGIAQPVEDRELSIMELQAAMAAGRASARTVTQTYLARIDAIDKDGPRLNSVLEINPEALSIADTLDAERKAGKLRGPLHGIPVLVKDNIDTGDRMQTTAGSLALVGSRAMRDASLVSQLRESGAIILGKTNLSEWANLRSSKSTSGWSGRGGLTLNPYALDRNTSGSSSGSGAATAANLCAAAIGTETDGSIVSPSSCNSLVGIKPTVGLVSRAGIIPISHSQDTAGPMARTVSDAAILLGALTGIDTRDTATADSRGRFTQDYTKYLDPRGLANAKLGVCRNYFGFNERVDKLIHDAISAMKSLGATIIDFELPNKGKYDDFETEVLLYEFKADLNKYLAARGANIRNMADVIEFNEKNKDRELQYFNQDMMIKSQAKGDLNTPAYKQALMKCRSMTREEGIDLVLKKYGVDALVAPTDGIPWLTDYLNADHFSGGCSTPPAVAGYPHITVPAGYINGLPVGVSFFGPAWSEGRLIKFAYSFEQATKLRRPPTYPKSASLL